MSAVTFQLTYDGPAVAHNEINVRDLAPAMLAVGETFEALNRLFNGNKAEIAVNVRAHEPGSFTVVFDVIQQARPIVDFFSGPEITAALNLRELLITGIGTGVGLIKLIKKLKGRAPLRITELEPGLFRLQLEKETFDVPIELLRAYKDFSVRTAIERFVAYPLKKEGIDSLRIQSSKTDGTIVKKEEAAYFSLPATDDQVIIDDFRRTALTIRDLSFDENGLWRLNEGSNRVRASITDEAFLQKIENDEIRFAKHDVLICDVRFIQRRTTKGQVKNEYQITKVLDHIQAPRQLQLPENRSFD